MKRKADKQEAKQKAKSEREPKVSRVLFGIRLKVVLVLLSVLIVALSINGWVAAERQKQAALKETKERGASIARMVSASLTYSVMGYDYDAIGRLLQQVAESDFIPYARVENDKHTVMGEAGKLPDDVENLLTFEENITLEGVMVGRLEIYLNTSKIIDEIKKERHNQTIREAFIILLVAIGEFIALSFIIVRPVGIISKSFRDSVNENGEIVGHIDIDSRDEFGELAYQFNQLRDDLNEANARLQSKINLADKKLLEANQKLLKQSLELKMKNKELQTLTLTDPLTGLYNRRQFENIIGAEFGLALRHGSDLSLMVLDIDFFKKINDTYGHAAGDVVLKEVGAMLKRIVRKSDVLCRIGGEEFVIMGKHLKRVDAVIVAEKIRRHIEMHNFVVDGQKIPVTVSVGVASLPCQAATKSTDDFFNCADSALYYSKEHGRNRVTHFADIVEQTNQTATHA